MIHAEMDEDIAIGIISRKLIFFSLSSGFEVCHAHPLAAMTDPSIHNGEPSLLQNDVREPSPDAFVVNSAPGTTNTFKLVVPMLLPAGSMGTARTRTLLQ
jgi:hypothetical protein